jgi:endonuclease-3
MNKSRNKEPLPKLKSRVRSMIRMLRKQYPHPSIALNYSNPLELLVAVILSAQCTDQRVNLVTAELFKKYKRASDYAQADPRELESDIRSTGFYRNKAKNIIACCKAIVEKHNGVVPNTMEELTALAGVGRKTANCVLGGAYGVAEGVVVDTHVSRLSSRLGLTAHDDAVKIEHDLMAVVPRRDWYDFGNLLIWHGRKVCQARRPQCPDCVLRRHCPSAEEFLASLNR